MTDGPGMALCRSHYERWRVQGRVTPLSAWFALVEQVRNPHVRLHDLGRQVRLEIQYGLQQRHQLGSQYTAPRVVTKAARWVRESGVHSLLDRDDAEWKALCRPTGNYDTLSLAFIKDTRFELHALLIADDPWADQYPREVWGPQAPRPEHRRRPAPAVRHGRPTLAAGSGQKLVPVATDPPAQPEHGLSAR